MNKQILLSSISLLLFVIYVTISNKQIHEIRVEESSKINRLNIIRDSLIRINTELIKHSKYDSMNFSLPTFVGDKLADRVEFDSLKLNVLRLNLNLQTRNNQIDSLENRANYYLRLLEEMEMRNYLIRRINLKKDSLIVGLMLFSTDRYNNNFEKYFYYKLSNLAIGNEEAKLYISQIPNLPDRYFDANGKININEQELNRLNRKIGF